MDKAIIIGTLIILSSQVFAQNNPTSSMPRPHKNHFILPLTLFSIGAITTIPDLKMNLQNNMFRTNTSVEDYLQFAPIFMMYGSYLFKAQHANSLGRQSLYWGIAAGISNILVFSVKGLTKVPRPGGNNDLGWAFPSGHTANAFVNATVLYEEFKDYNKFLAYSGYAIATSVAILRVSNNEHWTPDVLVGAGLGILITRLAYRLKIFK